MSCRPWEFAAGLVLGAVAGWSVMRLLMVTPDYRSLEGASASRNPLVSLGEVDDRVDAPTVAWLAASGTHCGKVRSSNEDRLLLRETENSDSLLAVVADGMGGHHGGALAAQIVVDTLGCLAEQSCPGDHEGRYEALLGALYNADAAVKERGAHEIGLGGMGSTVVAAWFGPTSCVHIYAGDSRLYQFRSGRVHYRTRDHSVVQVLVDQGQLTYAEARMHPLRSQLTSCMGGSRSATHFTAEPRWDLEGGPQAAVLEAAAGDVFLLCSDGLHGEVGDEELEGLVAYHGTSPEQLVEACIEASLDAGGRDNVAVVAVSYGSKASC